MAHLWRHAIPTMFHKTERALQRPLQSLSVEIISQLALRSQLYSYPSFPGGVLGGAGFQLRHRRAPSPPAPLPQGERGDPSLPGWVRLLAAELKRRPSDPDLVGLRAKTSLGQLTSDPTRVTNLDTGASASRVPVPPARRVGGRTGGPTNLRRPNAPPAFQRTGSRRRCLPIYGSG